MLTSNQGVSNSSSQPPEEPYWYRRLRGHVDNPAEWQQLVNFIRTQSSSGDTVKDAYLPEGRFISKLLGDVLLEERKYLTMRDTQDIYFCADGYYKPNGETLIAERCKEILGEWFTSHRASEAVAYIEAATYRDREDVTPPANLVPLLNDVFNLDTMQLQEYDGSYVFFNKIPVAYDPEAKCPNWLKFLDEVVRAEDILVLQEFVGFIFLRDYRFARALMLLGEGQNGKTTFINVLNTLVGSENVSNVPLQTFATNDFAKAQLCNKYLNTYADLSSTALHNTGVFKTLTGNDWITACFKHKNYFRFKNFAKLIFSTNNFPVALYDDTDAYYHRWMPITFPNQFLGDKADTRLLEKLTTPAELSGIFNWAMEGLKRLLAKGDFSYRYTLEQNRERIIRLSNTTQSFVMDCLHYNAESSRSQDDLYSLYLTYCDKNGLKPDPKNIFAMKLPMYLPGISKTRPWAKGERPWYWQGVAVNEDIEKAVMAVRQSGLSLVLPATTTTIEVNKLGNPKTAMTALTGLAGKEDVKTELLATAKTVRVRCTVPTCAKEFDLETAPDILLGNSRCPYCHTVGFLESCDGGDQTR